MLSALTEPIPISTTELQCGARLYHVNLLTAVQQLLNEVESDSLFRCEAGILRSASGERIYSELFTADWFRRQEAKVLSIIMYLDGICVDFFWQFEFDTNHDQHWQPSIQGEGETKK